MKKSQKSKENEAASHAARLKDFEAFWVHYLNEHKSPTSRRLHFLGTSGFLAATGAATALKPMKMSAALASFVGIMKHGLTVEKDRAPWVHVAAMVGVPSVASPKIFPAGVAFAYACAWAGHFGFEKNKPATFKYPLWSFAADLKMWSHMVRGRLWTTDDPCAELGIEPDDGPLEITNHEHTYAAAP